MAYEMRPNTGTLFKNSRKTEPTHAEYKGSALIDGKEYWMDVWVNTSEKGAKYMSMKFRPKTPGQGDRGQQG